MQRKIKTTSGINPKKFYNLYEIYRDDLFKTGIENEQTRKSRSRMIITTDTYTRNILQSSMVKDEVRGRKYAIKGSNILKYLAAKKDADTTN